MLIADFRRLIAVAALLVAGVCVAHTACARDRATRHKLATLEARPTSGTLVDLRSRHAALARFASAWIAYATAEALRTPGLGPASRPVRRFTLTHNGEGVPAPVSAVPVAGQLARP